MKVYQRISLVTYGLLVLVGCSSDPTAPEVDLEGLWGSVTFAFSGVSTGVYAAEREWDGNRSIRPYAVAAPVHQNGVEEAVRVLTGSADSLSFSLVLFHLPSTGVAAIEKDINGRTCGPLDPCVRSFFINGVLENGTPWIFVMLEGEVEVLARTDTRIRGRFDIAGVSLAEELGGITTPSAFLVGTFDLPLTLLGCDDAACD